MKAPQPKLRFVIAAAPTDGFFGQVAMFRLALDALGGPYAAASLVAVIGDEAGTRIGDRWAHHFRRVDTRYVPAEEIRAKSYWALGEARWRTADGDFDFIVFCDADTLVIRPFDDLLAELVAEPGIAGSVAHYPFPQFDGESPAERWGVLGAELIGRSLTMTYRHTLISLAAPAATALSPFYVNFGFVVVPRAMVEELGGLTYALRPLVAARIVEPFFSAQVALTLAIERLGLPRRAIDIRYNFPNDPIADDRYPQSLLDVRVLHYLRTTHFNRQRIFGSKHDFEGFLRLELKGSSRVFQQHVQGLTGGTYPFEAESPVI